jgi:EpsI family protein
LFAYLNFKTWTRRLIFLAVTLSFGVVANWIRAYLIVMLGHVTEMRWGIGLDHYIYGWVCFGITIFFVFALGARWRDVEPASAASVGVFSQLHTNSSTRVSGKGYRFNLRDVAPLLVAIIMLAVTPLVTHHFQSVTINASALKDVVSEIGPVSTGSLDLQPDYQGARSTFQGAIVDGAGTEVFVAYFAAQKTGNEMVAYGNGVVAREGNLWRVLSSRDRSFTYNGKPILVRELRLRKGSSDRLAWSWFTVGEKQVSSALYSKGLIAWAMLAGRGDHSVVSVVSTPMPTIQDVNGSVELSAEVKDARIRLEKAAGPVLKGLQSLAR